MPLDDSFFFHFEPSNKREINKIWNWNHINCNLEMNFRWEFFSVPLSDEQGRNVWNWKKLPIKIGKKIKCSLILTILKRIRITMNVSNIWGIYGRCASQIDECHFSHTEIAKCVKTKAVWVGIPSDISKVFPFDIDKYSFEYPFVTGENPFNLCIKWTYPGYRRTWKRVLHCQISVRSIE